MEATHDDGRIIHNLKHRDQVTEWNDLKVRNY